MKRPDANRPRPLVTMCCLGALVLFWAVLVGWGPALSSAATAPLPTTKIAILPLAYNGPAAQSSLVGEVSDGLARRFQVRGYTVTPAGGPTPSSLEEARSRGRTLGVDHVLYGSVNLIGTQVSIDLRLASVGAASASKSLYAQGGRNEMPSVLNQVEEKVVAELSAPYRVAAVEVRGNRRVDTDAILQAAATRKGTLYDPQRVASDIRAIYKMGFFDDVQAEVSEGPQGKTVIFLVREKPALRKVTFSGNHALTDKKIQEAIDLKPYTIINEKTLQQNAEKIQALYESKGYMGTTVATSVKPVSAEAADVTFEINEGEKVQIKKITFEGNKAFPDDELKGLLETSEKKPIWSPSLKNIMAMIKGEEAVLKWDTLERDAGRLAAFYHNHGYVDAKVGQPLVRRDGHWLYVTFPIDEGERYGVGRVDVQENYFHDKDKILKDLAITKEKVFNQEVLRQDVLKITDLFADQGFAFADVTPKIQKDPEKKVVNIDFVVNTGPKVTFERIQITGNTRTRDNVIRRELRVNELEPFSATGLRKSKDRLNRLGYFEDVNLTPTSGSSEDTMNLKVEVKERPTGTFSVGAGYSSVDKLIFMGEISQRNFRGTGDTLSFKGILGSTTNRYSFSFVNPYLNETPLSLGVDLYNWETEYDDYTRDSTGGALRFAYPLTDEWKVFWGARVDNTTLKDLSEYVSSIIRDSLDIKQTRSVTAGLTYDTRNDFYFPSRGWNNSVSVEYAGGVLGGDSAFLKLEGVASYYRPIWRKLIGHVRGGMGYVTQGSGGRLPVYERFFLGGIDSVRGYKYGRISPIDPATGDRIGGNYMGYVQMETIFPLIPDMGLNGVCFLDMGNVWDSDTGYDIGTLRKSVGLGVRWLSPMGPLRIEWGYNIDTQPGDDTSNWEFRMGGNF